MTHWGTMKMTPEFMQEMDDLEASHNPEFEGQRSYMSVTTDGSDVSREDVEAEVRKWVQARIDGKCRVMDSFPEEPRRKRTVAEFFAEIGAVE